MSSLTNIEVKYFVSVDETIYANRTLVQFFDADRCARSGIRQMSGERIDVYEIDRKLIKRIKSHSDLLGHVKFWTQSKDEPLKPMVFLKTQNILRTKNRKL